MSDTARTRATGSTELLLVRHGETAWNAEHRIQGQLDVPLSPRGVWQAQRLASRLGGNEAGLDGIVASDLARAVMTAEPLAAARGLTIRLDPRLRERHFGVFQGERLDDIAARWPEAFAAWRARHPDWAMDEGESATTFQTRVLAALREIAVRHDGGRVVVVAHGGVLDVAFRHARGLAWDAPREHQMLNAAINRLRARSTPTGVSLDVIDWADAEHLDASRDETLT